MISYKETLEIIEMLKSKHAIDRVNHFTLKEALEDLHKNTFIEIGGYLKSLSFWDRVKILFGRY